MTTLFKETSQVLRIDFGKQADSKLEHAIVSVNCKVRYMPVSTNLHTNYRKVQQTFMRYLYLNI